MNLYHALLMGLVSTVWLYQFVNYCKLCDLRDQLKELEEKVEQLYDK